ncbi:serine hydrolase [Acetobacterium wieringae]|uniref:serine hydrolase domain-containing protein n=1 Tax=Acetobacterium wieringae TaxID=52694 RepID=UPI0026EA993D|nr:serine hydrolase domain-containing protein [Acetobacterium wieringae]
MKLKKSKCRQLCFMIVLCVTASLIPGCVIAKHSIDPQQQVEINSMVKDVMEKSRIPSAGIAMVRGDEIEYLSLGFGDESNHVKINEHSLFQLGSTTKAFTGLGILLLEDEGKLALSDPVSCYIPWFTATYQGETIAAEDLTIADCLYQTSGYTNDERNYPSATAEMTLAENIQNLSNRELASAPGQQFFYANTNYNLLGLIIETVAKQDYQSFIKERILQPMGLIHTDCYTSEVKERMVTGRKLSFGNTYLLETPAIKGLVPSGYMISNASDMGRWLQIQMGIIEISPQFTRIIEKSHIANPASVVDEKTCYASGWFIDDLNSVIYHSGGTPNYSAKIAMKLSDGIGVCVLTNLNASANTNYLADNILLMLEGKETTPYQHDIWFIIDAVFSTITFICALLTGFLIARLFVISRQIKNNDRKKTTINRKRFTGNIIPGLLLIVTAGVIIVLPTIFKSDWLGMWLWAPVSLYIGIFMLSIFSLLWLITTLIISKYPSKTSD